MTASKSQGSGYQRSQHQPPHLSLHGNEPFLAKGRKQQSSPPPPPAAAARLGLRLTVRTSTACSGPPSPVQTPDQDPKNDGVPRDRAEGRFCLCVCGVRGAGAESKITKQKDNSVLASSTYGCKQLCHVLSPLTVVNCSAVGYSSPRCGVCKKKRRGADITTVGPQTASTPLLIFYVCPPARVGTSGRAERNIQSSYPLLPAGPDLPIVHYR